MFLFFTRIKFQNYDIKWTVQKAAQCFMFKKRSQSSQNSYLELEQNCKIRLKSWLQLTIAFCTFSFAFVVLCFEICTFVFNFLPIWKFKFHFPEVVFLLLMRSTTTQPFNNQWIVKLWKQTAYKSLFCNWKTRRQNFFQRFARKISIQLLCRSSFLARLQHYLPYQSKSLWVKKVRVFCVTQFSTRHILDGQSESCFVMFIWF